MNLKVAISPVVQKIIKKDIKLYIVWLRENYNFPLRVKIFISHDEFVKNMATGEKVSATIFCPFDKKDTAIIKVATGDFNGLLKENGKVNSMNLTMNSISHELQHYYQWVDDLGFDEEQAEDGAVELTCEYLDSKLKNRLTDN